MMQGFKSKSEERKLTSCGVRCILRGSGVGILAFLSGCGSDS